MLIGIACVLFVTQMAPPELPAEAAGSSVQVSAPMATTYAMPAGWTQPLLARVSSTTTSKALVTFDVLDSRGASQFWEARPLELRAGQSTDAGVEWTIPNDQAPGSYRLELTVYGATGALLTRNASALVFQVAAARSAKSASGSAPPPAPVPVQPPAPLSVSSSPTSMPSTSPAPVAGQPCPAWVHDRYVANGPDGKSYATWHPPVDAQYGCVFGHEHGDNPAGSPALNGRQVLFGYAAERMNMSEPHPGYKVFRQDNIHDAHAPNHDGSSVVMTLHQGTSGAARFTQVYHDVSVHYVNPRDGREVHIQMLAPFGTLAIGCGANDPGMLLRVVQAPVPGMRQVAADKCFNTPSVPYEDWITALYIGTHDPGGKTPWKAYIDPHFAVNRPNTYCVVTNGSCSLATSDVRARTGADPASGAAWFKGTVRDTYLNQVWLDNAGADPIIWTDAHGETVSRTTPGAIAQFVAPIHRTPVGESIAFGLNREHAVPSVHAPN